MKNALDYCLLGLVVCIGLGLMGVNVVLVLAQCPDSQEGPGMCSSCQHTYQECAFISVGNEGESGSGEGDEPPAHLKTYICSGGGLTVNSDGPFGVKSGLGRRVVSGGRVWCTTSAVCKEIHIVEEMDGMNLLVVLCIQESHDDTAQSNDSEPCGG